jgi:hypothetical protein
MKPLVATKKAFYATEHQRRRRKDRKKAWNKIALIYTDSYITIELLKD